MDDVMFIFLERKFFKGFNFIILIFFYLLCCVFYNDIYIILCISLNDCGIMYNESEEVIMFYNEV